jgi:putative zinc finger protein
MSRDDVRHRAVWELLPWYVNDTLSGRDLDLVTGHLTACSDCAEEVTRCRDLAVTVATVTAVARAPSAERLARLLARIDAIEATGARHGGWRGRLRDRIDALRELLERTPAPTRWALAAQGALVVLLVAALAWQMALSSGQPYRTLGSAPEQPPRGQAQIRIVFADDISEREMRAALERVKGRIVDGPSAVGAYTIEVPVPATASERVAPVLEVLRTQPKVRLAEPIHGR